MAEQPPSHTLNSRNLFAEFPGHSSHTNTIQNYKKIIPTCTNTKHSCQFIERRKKFNEELCLHG